MKTSTRLICFLLLFFLLIISCGPLGTATPSVTPTPLPTAVAGEFASDGELDQGWYWVDTGYPTATHWMLSSIQPDEDIALDLAVLATDENQTRGLNAVFSLSLEIEEGGQFYELNRRIVTLPNISSDENSPGLTCSGRLVIDHTLIPQGTTTLWVWVNPLEEAGADPLTATRLAFRPESLQVGPAPLPMASVNSQVYQTGEFDSNGDLIDG